MKRRQYLPCEIPPAVMAKAVRHFRERFNCEELVHTVRVCPIDAMKAALDDSQTCVPMIVDLDMLQMLLWMADRFLIDGDSP